MTTLLCMLALAAHPVGQSGEGNRELVLELSGESAHSGPSTQIPYVPQPGDLFLFHINDVIRRSACFLSFSGTTNHSAIVVARHDGTMALLETPDYGARVMLNDIPFGNKRYTAKIWVRRRRVPLTAEESAKLTAFAYAQEGKPYDYFSMFTVPLKWPVRLHRGADAKNLEDLHKKRRWFCTSLITGGCFTAGLLDPATIRLDGCCADDFQSDLIVDISSGWEKAQRCIVVPTTDLSREIARQRMK